MLKKLHRIIFPTVGNTTQCNGIKPDRISNTTQKERIDIHIMEYESQYIWYKIHADLTSYKMLIKIKRLIKLRISVIYILKYYYKLTFFWREPMNKKNVIDRKIVGTTYRKNNHAGLAYQLITFPSLVRISAINVHESIDTSHETIIAPVHNNKCFKYIDFFVSKLKFKILITLKLHVNKFDLILCTYLDEHFVYLNISSIY